MTQPEKPLSTEQSRQADFRQTARTHFDKWAHGYDTSRLNELVFFPAIRICQEEIARWQQLRGQRNYRLLDVGCGTGRLVHLLARQADAEQLVGLDYSPVMVQKLSKKTIEAGLERKVHAVVADSERLPFADQSFDIVTCCNSFHHYPHQPEVIRGFHRVLRPGGLLLLVDGFRDNVIGWVVFDVGVATVEKDVHHAPWSEVHSMISAAGFTTLRQRKVNVLAPLLVNVALR